MSINKKKQEEKEVKRLLKEKEKKEKEAKRLQKIEEKERLKKEKELQREEKERLKKEKEENKSKVLKEKNQHKESKQIDKLKKYCLKSDVLTLEKPLETITEVFDEDFNFKLTKEQKEKFRELRKDQESSTYKLYPVNIVDCYPSSSLEDAKKLLNQAPTEDTCKKESKCKYSWKPDLSYGVHTPWMIFEFAELSLPNHINFYENYFRNSVTRIDVSNDCIIWDEGYSAQKKQDKGAMVNTIYLFCKAPVKYIRVQFAPAVTYYEIFSVEMVTSPIVQQHTIELNRGAMKLFCDLEVIIDDRNERIKCKGHKVVFSKSEIWRKIIKKYDTLKIEMDIEVFKIIYHYLYFGELTFQEEDKQKVMDQISKYQILLPFELVSKIHKKDEKKKVLTEEELKNKEIRKQLRKIERKINDNQF